MKKAKIDEVCCEQEKRKRGGRRRRRKREKKRKRVVDEKGHRSISYQHWFMHTNFNMSSQAK